ncbi:hypothetical protein AB0L70_27610 [Kribbella sp. NPDC051952]|uniref:hypothetical protein n=1 Tax=Kribbella sp. NPDC051952 TaxID=3154851 RepID=UPI00341B5672
MPKPLRYGRRWWRSHQRCGTTACVGEGPPPAERLAKLAQPVLLSTGATLDPHSAGLPVDFFGAAADAAAHACRTRSDSPFRSLDMSLIHWS